MSTRRIQALEALVERGATEGEREAARIALEKHRAAPRKPPEQPRTRGTDNTAFTDFLNSVWRTAPDIRFQDPMTGQYYTFTGSGFRRPPTPPPKPEPAPCVTQVRQATSADYRNTMSAVDGDEPDTILVEVATMEDMWLHFKQAGVTRMFNLRGNVWQFSDIKGVQHDRQFGRCYLKIDRCKAQKVMVPV